MTEQIQNQSVDVKYAIKQVTSVVVRVFGTIPKHEQMTEFYSLLREILYYQ